MSSQHIPHLQRQLQRLEALIKIQDTVIHDLVQRLTFPESRLLDSTDVDSSGN